MKGFVILDIGHVGKASTEADPGAVVDLDRDGRREASESEVAHVIRYLVTASAELGRRGHQVMLAGFGDYPDRHARIVGFARAWLKEHPGTKLVYAQGHLNIGASRGMILHDSRSESGARAASAVVAALGLACPTLDPQVVAATADGPWRNARACVSGIYAGPPELCGLCLEPLSLDVHSLDQLETVGWAIGVGLANWLEAA